MFLREIYKFTLKKGNKKILNGCFTVLYIIKKNKCHIKSPNVIKKIPIQTNFELLIHYEIY